MKKTALTTICALAVTGAVLGQGTVNWGNTAFIPTYISAQTNTTAYSPFFTGFGTPIGGAIGAAGGSAPAGTGFYYELLYSAFSGTQATISSLSQLLSWKDAGLTATNSSSPGRLVASNPVNSGATVPWPSGTTNSIVLVGWSANLGTSWLSVSNLLANWNTVMSGYTGQNVFFGISATGYINPYSTGTSPGAALFAGGPSTQGLPINSPNTQLYLLPVPEPGTLALAGLGGLSLLFFRRRK